MKILFVYDSMSPIGGGSQIAVLNWIKNLNKMGIESKLLSTNPIDLNFIIPKYSISFLLKKQREEINKFEPDIIHINEPSILSKQVLDFANKKKIKILFSYHTDINKVRANHFPASIFLKKNSLLNRFVEKIQSEFIQKSDAITVPSKTYRLILNKKFNKRSFLLPYPIQNYFFSKKTDKYRNIKKLITVSRLSGEKNIAFLIEIMGYLKGKFSLTIVGDGIDKNFLINMAKRSNLDKYVKFTGWITNKHLPNIYALHDAFISASNFETFGITYIEALASKLPCFVSDYAVSREIIPNNMAIFIKGYSPKKWADKLLEIQDNKYAFDRLKRNISDDFDKISQYNEIESAKKLIEIYKKMI